VHTVPAEQPIFHAIRPTHDSILYEVMSQTERQPQPKVTVYTTEPCSFCARVKGLLEARGVDFSEVNLSKDAAGRVKLAGRTGMMTFPQVLVGEQLLGGYAETLSALQSGRLDELLAV
jgi:glutaredoxin 3